MFQMYNSNCCFLNHGTVDLIASDDVVPGFVDYSYKHILPTCFIAPLESSFNLNDGHSFLVWLNLRFVCICVMNLMYHTFTIGFK